MRGRRVLEWIRESEVRHCTTLGLGKKNYLFSYLLFVQCADLVQPLARDSLMSDQDPSILSLMVTMLTPPCLCINTSCSLWLRCPLHLLYPKIAQVSFLNFLFFFIQLSSLSPPTPPHHLIPSTHSPLSKAFLDKVVSEPAPPLCCLKPL